MTAATLSQIWERKARRRQENIRAASYDVDDKRADVFRRPGDGTVNDGLRWRDCMWQAIREWNLHTREAGKGVRLPGGAMRVLEALLFTPGLFDFRTGQLDPSLERLTELAGCARDTVVRSLKLIKECRILNWVRRTYKVEGAGKDEPQRKQATNAYYFTPENMPKRLANRFRELLVRRRLKARTDGARTVHEAARIDAEQRLRTAPAGTPAHALQGALDSLGTALSKHQPESDSRPLSPVQNIREAE